MLELWSNSLYRGTVLLILGALAVFGAALFPLRKRNAHTMAAWASLKSWLFAAPLLLALLGLAPPWPLVVLTAIAMTGAKTYFQMMGMYHRSNFVWATYVGIIALALCIHFERRDLYNVAPMAFLGVVCLIPILRNSAKDMIQYMSLTLLAFMFLGWSFMHLGYLWSLPGGPFMTIYIIVLTEVCDNIYLAMSRHFGKIKLFSRISPRRNLEAFAVAAVATLGLAWALRHLLPDRSDPYWIASGVVAALGGSLGDLTLSVIRRDLGIRDVGPFIIGRGDLLSVMDRMIFVAPIFFYAMAYLNRSAAA